LEVTGIISPGSDATMLGIRLLLIPPAKQQQSPIATY